jgi:subtilisin-like proprotein convertase family protein
MVIGPDIADTLGNLMNQDRDGTNGETPDDQYTVSFGITDTLTFNSDQVPLSIIDWGTTISGLQINQDITIGDVNLQLNITHSYVGDLRLILVAPDGSTVRLISSSFFRGGQNFRDTIFDDEATTGIRNGRAPFTGSYRPEQALATLDGKNARGYWQLRVDDVFPIDEGVINSWSLTFKPGGSPASPTNLAPTAEADSDDMGEDVSLAIPGLIKGENADGSDALSDSTGETYWVEITISIPAASTRTVIATLPSGNPDLVKVLTLSLPLFVSEDQAQTPTDASASETERAVTVLDAGAVDQFFTQPDDLALPTRPALAWSEEWWENSLLTEEISI